MKFVKGALWLLGICFLCALSVMRLRDFGYFQPSAEKNWSAKHTRVATLQRKSSRDDMIRREAALIIDGVFTPLKSYANYFSIDNPPLVLIDDEKTLHEQDVLESTPVIGIECLGDAIAFIEKTLFKPRPNVINLNLQKKKSLTVTFDQLADSVRVFASDSPSLIPMQYGGRNVQDKMILALDGVLIPQDSQRIPLADHPFERMNLGRWTRLHPDTKVCIPNSEMWSGSDIGS